MKMLLFWAIYCSVCGFIGASLISDPVYITRDSIPIAAPAPEDQ